MNNSLTNLLIIAFSFSEFFKVLALLVAIFWLHPLRKEAKGDPGLVRLLGGFMYLAVGFGLSDVFDFLLAASNVVQTGNVGVSVFLLAIYATGMGTMLIGMYQLRRVLVTGRLDEKHDDPTPDEVSAS